MKKSLINLKLLYQNNKVLRYRHRIHRHKIVEEMCFVPNHKYHKNYEKKSDNKHISRLIGNLQGDEICALCGNSKQINRHHENYNLPYVIIYLCNQCHQKIHLIEKSVV